MQEGPGVGVDVGVRVGGEVGLSLGLGLGLGAGWGPAPGVSLWGRSGDRRGDGGSGCDRPAAYQQAGVEDGADINGNVANPPQ